MSIQYTFSIPAHVYFDVEADNEEEARKLARDIISECVSENACLGLDDDAGLRMNISTDFDELSLENGTISDEDLRRGLEIEDILAEDAQNNPDRQPLYRGPDEDDDDDEPDTIDEPAPAWTTQQVLDREG